MATGSAEGWIEAVRRAAQPMRGAANDHDALLELIGDARFVLLGEASHGSSEFYRERARITQRLIDEKGFAAVAVEADWPDAYRVNRYVRGIVGDAGAETDTDAVAALSGFRRFPAWMWRNAEVAEFVEWLRHWNASRNLPAQGGAAIQVGFYGLDLYSLFISMEEVLRYLDRTDPEAARRARARYACFDHCREDSQKYGYQAAYGKIEPCEEGVIAQLADLEARAARHQQQGGKLPDDDLFHAQQNARLVKNAEQYYRAMFQRRVSSWNLRDRHMADTLEALAQHLSRPGAPAKIVVWEHNSHVGDASCTEIGRQGEWNVGQLAREAYGDDAVLVGFTTHHGKVIAASEWDAPPERKSVRPALDGSWEQLFHRCGMERFMLPLRASSPAGTALRDVELLERAIGVIYLPETERHSHYFHAHLARQFDAVIHIDETRAVRPLDAVPLAAGVEPPETYPQGL